jgi:HNH endonuclease
MPRKKADFDWYSAESRKQKLPPRCPLASAELCPRYYASRTVLASEGATTSIPPERAEALGKKWDPFQGIIAEEEPNLDLVGHEHSEEMKLSSVNHFCPEVSYDSFGYFASHLHRYTDDRDAEGDFGSYQRDGISDQFDSNWAAVTPHHYTECREYSIHGTFAGSKPSGGSARRSGPSPKLRWQALARDSFTCQYCGRKPPEVALTVDHKVSVKDGGTDELDNLVTACEECNGGKGPSSL